MGCFFIWKTVKLKEELCVPLKLFCVYLFCYIWHVMYSLPAFLLTFSMAEFESKTRILKNHVKYIKCIYFKLNPDLSSGLSTFLPNLFNLFKCLPVFVIGLESPMLRAAYSTEALYQVP